MITLPTDMNMAQIEAAARAAHEANRFYCESIGDTSQPTWDDAPHWQTYSAVNGVLHMVENPSSTPEQSHNNWMLQKERDGWTWGPEKDPGANKHPCMVPYDDLPSSQQVKDKLFQAVVRAVLDL